MHKMQQLKHFLLTKLMNYRHTYLASYALKLLYGNLGSKKFSGGETPESPFKVHPQPKILATPMRWSDVGLPQQLFF